MKKLLVLVAVFVSSLAIAQGNTNTSSSSKPVKFGLKLGFNLAKLTDSESADVETKSRIGVNIGGFLYYKFSEKFAFQPELVYSTQGLVQQGSSEGINVDITYRMDYILLPLMVKYYPAKDFYIELGPQLGFNVKKELEAEGNGQSLTWDTDDFFDQNNIDAKTNTFDFGLNFGLGYEFKNGLGIGGRYALGLTKVFEGNDVVDGNGSSQNIKNSVFSLGLAYRFN
ncbi:porin family protein [Flavobacterium capsici]|uniref:Porin family protein n=1 Tax=Flavobacterium capsici TaxID=3075618 RepID=A0AA96F140_9FLAO|nr:MULTISPECIES: porin family protein [unclassified Flavobacterium]WNM18136.1 porin family protein [Flavobacterium sp. PMR2A8]WNM22188.1 porin family protein [Flavobacterium sp. PMTSA4]